MEWTYDGETYKNPNELVTAIFDDLTRDDIVDAMFESTFDSLLEDLVWDLVNSKPAYMERLGIKKIGE